MRAAVGDKLVIKRHNAGDHDRVGVIRSVRGDDGHPPWVVEWLDKPGEHLFWPGPDATIEPFEHPVEPVAADRR